MNGHSLVHTPISRRRRSGFSLTELVVAAGVLVTAIATITPLSLQGSRLLQDVRRQRLALEELSNQVERLSAIDQDQLADAIGDLAPSPRIARALPSAELTAERIEDELGHRLIVRMTWDRVGNPPPLELVAWLPELQELQP